MAINPKLLAGLASLVLLPAAGATLTPPKLRLPADVHPSRYRVDLRLNPGEDRFSGSVEIDLAVTQQTSVIWLHAKALQFVSVKLTSKDGEQAAIAQPAADDFIGITFDHVLATGNATLHLAYSGEISRNLTDGIFQQQQGGDWYVFTKFEPVTARRAFPCFDEPSFKVPWQLTLHVPEKLKAYSNTPVEEEHEEGNAGKVVRFQQTRPLPSYLVAFAVGPFDVVTTKPVGQNQVPSRIIVPRGRQSEAEYAASVTPDLIALLERYYGTPYPYQKLDQVVVPLTTAWGAMENAGLIAYGDFLLAPRKEDTELRQRGRANTMLHEMSHQWFGDLVTTSWWNDIWLNEAFASWIAAKLLDEAHPDWKIRTEQASRIGVLQLDSLTTARKIRQPIETPADIGNAFDGITYAKGSAVIGMFENYVTAPVFQQAIRLYLSQHAWGNARAEDLLLALDSVAGPGVGAAFSTFLNQGGFPLIHVKLDCGKPAPELQLSQERFLPAGSEGSTDAVWQVPICLTWQDAGGEHSQCKILAKAQDSVPLAGAKGCPAWVFSDRNAAGYYATTYDAKLFDDVASVGLPKLKAAERAAFLRGIELNFSMGKGDAATSLAAAQHFSHDPERVIVDQTVDIVASADRLVEPEIRPNYARFVRALYAVRAHELGWKPRPEEAEETRLSRFAIVPFVATEGEDAVLQSEAAELADAWLKDRGSLDEDIAGEVLAAAAVQGSKSYFDALVQAAKTTKVKPERDDIIDGLASFRDPAIEKSALQLFFESGIDARELTPILFGSNQKTRDAVWDFVRQNFDRLNTELPSARGIPFGSRLPLVTAGYCDDQHHDQVAAFFQDRIGSLPGLKRNLDNTLERIRLCTARAAALKPGLIEFLKRQPAE